MKVLVCGGRDFEDREFVNRCLDAANSNERIRLVITGGARGADTLAAEWAFTRRTHCAVVRALWDGIGKTAGPARNAAMLDLNPDAVIAFPGGAGTADMVRRARAAGLPVWKPKPTAAVVIA